MTNPSFIGSTSVPCHFPSQEYNKNYLNEIEYALENNLPYSWIRIGDGEIAILQQEYVHPIDYLVRNVAWAKGNLTYCGSQLPNLQLRDRIIQGLRESDLVGVFKGDPPTEQVLQAIGVQPKSICYAFDNLALPMNKQFVNIIIKYPPLLVGRDAKFFAQKFKEVLDVDVPGVVDCITDYSQIERCMNEMMQYEYKLACVCAGANAKAICPEMKKRKPAVYLDMGHSFNNCFHPPPLYQEYFMIKKWKPNEIYSNQECVIHEGIQYRLVRIEPYSSDVSPDVDIENWYIWQ